MITFASLCTFGTMLTLMLMITFIVLPATRQKISRDFLTFQLSFPLSQLKRSQITITRNRKYDLHHELSKDFILYFILHSGVRNFVTDSSRFEGLTILISLLYKSVQYIQHKRKINHVVQQQLVFYTDYVLLVIIGNKCYERVL